MALQDADMVAQPRQLGLISGAVAKGCGGEVDEEPEAGAKDEQEHGGRLIVAGLCAAAEFGWNFGTPQGPGAAAGRRFRAGSDRRRALRPRPVERLPARDAELSLQLSGHGALHVLFSSASFLSLIVVASVVFARRFAALGRRGLAVYAVAAGVCFLAAWAALIVTAAGSSVVNVAFPAAVALSWALITVVAAQLLAGRDGRRSS